MRSIQLIHLHLLKILISLNVITAIGPVHEEILQWWKKVSVQKPIQCKMNPIYTLPFQSSVVNNIIDDLSYVPVVKSYPCSENDQKYLDYKFKGNITNGHFEGPGKLKIFDHWDIDTIDEKAKETCISTIGNQGNMEVVGTFKNGILQGVAKMTLQDKSTTISNFVNGEAHGAERLWGPDKKLFSYSYRIKRQQKSKCWKADETYIYVSDYCSIVQEDDDFSSIILIPFDIKEEILVGSFNVLRLIGGTAEGVIEELHSANLEITSNEKDCFMMLKWHLEKRKDYKLILNLSGKHKKVPLLKYKTQPMCTQENSLKPSNSEKKPEKQFVLWENYLINTNDSRYPPNGYEVLDLVKPEESQMEENKVQQNFLGNDVKIFTSKYSIYVNFSHWNGESVPWIAKKISFDSNGHLHGICTFSIEKKFMNHTGTHDFLNWSIKYFHGKFVHGKLQGMAYLETLHGYIFVTFKDNELHGPAFSFGRYPIYDMAERGFIRNIPKDEVHAGTHFLGRFKNGQVVGHFWIGMLNSGYIHGIADSNGLATGEDMNFIYLDGETAFKGHFENKYMKKAKNVDVKKYGCDENGMFIATEFTEPLSDYEFSYDPCTNETFGGGSKEIPDPYEMKTVKLSTSIVENSGEGVIMKRDIPKERVACFYSLYLYNTDQFKGVMNEWSYANKCFANEEKSDEYRRDCNKYTINLETWWKGHIGLPPEMDVNPLPTLGPKVNHHFIINNARYLESEHPRWGSILSVVPERDLKVGEELFTYYSYEHEGQQNFPLDHPWYFAALEVIEKEKEEAKKKSKKLKKKKKKTNL